MSSFRIPRRNEAVHWFDVSCSWAHRLDHPSEVLRVRIPSLRKLTIAALIGAIVRPSFKKEKVAGENPEVSKWVDKYLGVGEWVMDQSVAIAGSSGWFERTR